MPIRRFVESFNAAIEGFIYVLKTERNMRIHFLATILIILFGIYLGFTKIEIMVLCITAAFVLFAEMANTVTEHLVDMVKPEFHPLAKIIKDIAAACVLVAAINAIIVGYMLFATCVPFDIQMGMSRIRESPWHMTFMSLIIVLGVVIFGKVISRKGKPLRGGMPSGHAAVAFSVWTVITFLTTNTVVVVLTFFLAFLIARQRIKDAIHSIWEVFVGSLIGILATTLVFQFFR